MVSQPSSIPQKLGRLCRHVRGLPSGPITTFPDLLRAACGIGLPFSSICRFTVRPVSQTRYSSSVEADNTDLGLVLGPLDPAATSCDFDFACTDEIAFALRPSSVFGLIARVQTFVSVGLPYAR